MLVMNKLLNHCELLVDIHPSYVQSPSREAASARRFVLAWFGSWSFRCNGSKYSCLQVILTMSGLRLEIRSKVRLTYTAMSSCSSRRSSGPGYHWPAWSGSTYQKYQSPENIKQVAPAWLGLKYHPYDMLIWRAYVII